MVQCLREVRFTPRARFRLVWDRNRARRRLGSFLLRHGRVYRSGQFWTGRHEQWLLAQTFHEPAVQATFRHYVAVVTARGADVDAIDADLAPWFEREPFSDPVRRLSAYRGIGRLTALSISSEVCDWRRFPTAGRFMGFVGLVPSEYSWGGKTQRGR